ncbi:MAG: hypothetical protein ABEK17_03805 [Candidatus Aenigmatarchaeota archaeon]
MNGKQKIDFGKVKVEIDRKNKAVWVKTEKGIKHLCQHELKRIAENEEVGDKILFG